jgi:purine-binding chemotaxis protein CheW
MSAALAEANDLDVDALNPAADAVQDNQFVTFSVAGEMFAVPMGPVQEIIRVPDVARLPLAPPALDGLANLRGRVLPIVNLRRLFNTDERVHDDSTRALVINIGQPLGFVVDHVASVVSVEPSQIEPADSIQSIVATDYLTGVIKRPAADGSTQLLLTLDFEHLVHEEFSAVSRSVKSTSGAQRTQDEVNASVTEQVANDDLRLVSFAVDGQEYAIDIADVQEIVQVPEAITALPNTPSHVLGVISLRQRLLPLVSLRTLFGLPSQSLTDQHRIVVVALPGGVQVGLVTDSVKEVLSVPRRHADEMPALLSRGEGMQEFSSICRLDDGKRLVSIIATSQLLGSRVIQDALRAGDALDASDPETRTMNQHSTNALTDDDTQVVIFRLGAEEFGVPIMSVQEIVRVPDVLTKVPKTPHFVEGVINLRGTVLPVIDQRARLGMPGIERNDRQRIMVFTLGGLRTGFIVDSVAEVLRIPQGHVEAAPTLSQEQSQLISRVAKLNGDKRMVMLIDTEKLLARREVAAVQGIGGDGDPDGELAASSGEADVAPVQPRSKTRLRANAR